MAVRQKIAGSLLALVGFMLSPLSWWNDLLINIPLALAFAWAISLVYPAAFQVAVIVGYWITNVLGFVLMHKGVQQLVRAGEKRYSRRDFAKDMGISVAYTVGIIVLLKTGVLQPFEQYFEKG